jgi:hypothetical protein
MCFDSPLDPGIKDVVEVLVEAGVETFELVDTNKFAPPAVYTKSAIMR